MIRNAGFEKLPNRTALSNETVSELGKFPADWPEVEYLGLAFNSGPANDTTNDHIFLAASQQNLSSKGSVTISSASANDPPKFDPNILTTKLDMDIAVEAVKRARALAVASGQQLEERAPGPSVRTDEQIRAWVKNNAVVGDHASSTCAMGKASDPKAVVDPQGRVYGVTGLRVVDASILPFLPPGHPLSSVYAIAEKIAHDIISQKS